ncbi:MULTISPECIES: DUF2939 domain-containing protein [unclassified Bradyrhizobium]
MRWLVGIVAAFLICLLTYAGSAFVSVLELVSALRSGDAAQVVARTNLPRIRHSVVDQVVSAYLDRIGQKRPVRPFERMAVNAVACDNRRRSRGQAHDTGKFVRPVEERHRPQRGRKHYIWDDVFVCRTRRFEHLCSRGTHNASEAGRVCGEARSKSGRREC